METKNTILGQKDLYLLQEMIVKFGAIVSFEQIKEAFGNIYSVEELRHRISLLAQRGWLLRLKRGLFIIISDISSFGVSDLSPFIISQALNANSYISMENALQFHGMFDQSLITTEGITAGRARTYKLNKSEVYTFSHIRKELYFGFTEEYMSGKTVRIAEAEKALLDMLYFRNSTYTVNLVLEKLRDYKHKLDFAKLQEYTQKYGVSMMRIVGFLLDQIGEDTSDLNLRVKVNKNSYNKLTHDASVFNAKWRLYYDTNALI